MNPEDITGERIEVPTGASNGVFSVGDRVSPSDRDNVGTVIEELGGDRYRVEFVSLKGIADKVFEAKELRPLDSEGAAGSQGLPPPEYKLHTAEEILNWPPAEWLIDGVLLGASFAVLFGEPGSFKTFLALDWALSIAAGRDWCGRVTKKAMVVYVAAEGVGGIKKRLHGSLTADSTRPT